jgi:hypothetical protein
MENAKVTFENGDGSKKIIVNISFDDTSETMDVSFDFGEGGSKMHGDDLHGSLAMNFAKEVLNIG